MNHLPMYCLCVPFIDENDPYICASNLPWELTPIGERTFQPGFLEEADGAVYAIDQFFRQALDLDTSFVIELNCVELKAYWSRTPETAL